jgi:RNA polymerase sigma-70 factor (ECF subfamily)
MESTHYFSLGRMAPINGHEREKVSQDFPAISEPAPSDEELLKLCKSDGRNAFQELVRRHQATIYQFLFRMLDSEPDAERAAIEVFTRIRRDAAKLSYRYSVTVWLYRIAASVVREHYARRRGQPQIEWPDCRVLPNDRPKKDALRLVAADDLQQAVWKALNQLGETDRLIWVLYYLEDRPFHEVVKITCIPKTMLQIRLSRLRERMRIQTIEKRKQ